MKYGYFDDQKREYVITNPETPYPWINYLGEEDFFTLISNSAGGYSFYKDARMLRLTRYRYNNVPTDAGGKYFYINDGGVLWTPGWMPVKTPLEFYECRHGMGYTRITGRKNCFGTARIYRRSYQVETHKWQPRRERIFSILIRRVVFVERI